MRNFGLGHVDFLVIGCVLFIYRYLYSNIVRNIRHEYNHVAKPDIHHAGRGTELCALCGRNGDLQASHIIPKFVVKWLKDTSATRALARINGNNVEHAQDIPTYRMLCSSCEQRFSSLEKQFAEKIFYPFHKNDDNRRLEYGSWLERFAISLGWRVLRMEYEAFKSNHPKFGPQIEAAEATWREFLLSNRQAVHPYESHLLILGSVDNDTDGIHEKTTWYMRRSADCTVGISDTRIFTYAKLADMVFVTALQPNVLKGWTGTRINKSGAIASPHTIEDGDFGGFLQSRVELTFPPTLRPSPARERRFQKAVQKDSKRVLESDSIQIETDQMISRYKQRMAGMPPSVIELVDVIGGQVASTRAETTTNIWKSRRILNALADLSVEEAEKLHYGIEKSIDWMNATGHSALCRLKANSIHVTFIASHSLTKAQNAAIAKAQADIVTEQHGNDTPFAVFSMSYNGVDVGVSFESVFMVPSTTSCAEIYL